jgi:hypothetical protein
MLPCERWCRVTGGGRYHAGLVALWLQKNPFPSFNVGAAGRPRCDA